MKFLFLFLLIAGLVMGLRIPAVREGLGLFLRKTWGALLIAALVAVVLFVLAYSGIDLRFF